MKLGIIAAMEEELKELVAHLVQPQKTMRHGIVFYQGILGRHDVVLVQSGIGKVMSALATTLLIDRFEVDGVINTGSAGALNSQLKVGDVIVADRLAYHDVDVTAFGYQYGQMAGQPLYFESSKYFVSEFKKQVPSARQGLVSSSDSFVASSQQQAAIKQVFPDVLAVEMEGASIAQVATAMQIPFLVVRSISDTADHQATVSFDQFIITAGKQSARAVIDLLTHML